MTSTNMPAKITLHQQSGGLSLIWSEDDRCVVSGDLLRKACRCATCRNAQVQGIFEPGNYTSVIDVKPFGVAGLQLFFSDGHNRGVFPWAYLRELGQGYSS